MIYILIQIKLIFSQEKFYTESRFESESFWNIAGHISAPGSFLFRKWRIFAFIQISVGVNPKFVQKTKLCIISVEILPIFFFSFLCLQHQFCFGFEIVRLVN